VGGDGEWLLNGRKVVIDSEVGSLKTQDFDDRIESIRTHGGCRWLAYRAPNFEVYTYILEPNRFYPNPSTWGGNANEISSVRPLPDSSTEAIVLFRYAHFGGRMVVLEDSVDDLSSIDFNDATNSFIITGGTWTLFESAGYTGKGAILPEGDYPTAAIYLSHIGGSRVLSSVRKGG
jgi:hypothetical protein